MLKELTTAIEELSKHYGITHDDLVTITTTIEPKQYKIPTIIGELWGEMILKTADVAAIRNKAKLDTMLEFHNHPEYEILYVKKGKVVITYKDTNQVIVIKEKELYIIQPNTNHTFYWPIDTEFLSIIIPGE